MSQTTTKTTATLPGANVTGVVRAPIAKVWELYRKFGPEILSWWPIYEWAKLEDPCVDEVGCVRAFKTNTGRTYRENLVARDDEKYVLKYGLLDIQPAVPTLTDIQTTVEFQAKSATETLVHWTSEVHASSIFAGKIVATQEDVYRAAIVSLDRHFNPSLGKLALRVVSAVGLTRHGLLPPDPYVVADLDHTGPKTSSTATRTTNPRWDDSLEFEVVSLDGNLRLGVWDSRAFGHDDFLGSVEIDLHAVPAGHAVTRKLALQEVPGGELTVELTLTLEDGTDHLAYSAAVEEQHHGEELLKVIAALRDQTVEIFSQLGEDDPKVYGYARYARDPLCPDVPFENLPRLVKGYPVGQLLPPHKIGHVVERLTEYVYAQAQFPKRLAVEGADRWRALYHGPIAPPEPVIARYAEDSEFGRQLLQGVNPMVIARLTDPAKVPPALAGLSAQGLTAPQLAEAGRLFLLDYALLDGLPQYRDMYFYAPLALVYRELLDGGKSRLTLLGFQLARGADAEVFQAGQTPPNRYKLARLHLACADNQYHQFIFHLGFAHLAMEPFAVAHHNAFPAEHPIGRFLAPHFRDTIGINTLARQTLVSPIVPFTDRTFSPGTVGAMRVFLKAYDEWDFWGTSFPAHLAARGFDEAGTDGVEGYSYRDDGFLIWNALTAYVRDVVETVYQDDAAVAADAVIQGWAAECVDPERAAIKGFPARFDTRDLLVRALTTIIFTCSAQHSAVNFPQFDYLSYLPNRPDSMFKPMPTERGEVDEAAILDAMPGFATMQFQVMFAHMLTTPSDHVLADLEGARDLFPALHAKHAARFAEISAVIQARNTALESAGEMPYPYLHPERIAASIDV